MQEERRGRRPRPVRLTARERKQLLEIAGQYGRPYREVLRARILLVLERDPCVSAAARRLEVDVKTVRRWRDRFVEKRHKEALRDKPRSGRPPQIGLLSRCELLSMACGRPSDFGERTRDVWTIDSLLERFRRRRSRPSMSRTSVIRILSEAEIRPHRVRMWLHSPDPEFRPKVKRICRLYLRPPRDGVVLCIDEKRRKTVDILDFMEAVARRYPRKKIYVIWDNLNIHRDGKHQRWNQFNRRHGNRFRFFYTPIHASWVNQVEIFFGIVQKRVLRYGVFNSARELEGALHRFIRHWNHHEAHPFRWTFKGYPLQSTSTAA